MNLKTKEASALEEAPNVYCKDESRILKKTNFLSHKRYNNNKSACILGASFPTPFTSCNITANLARLAVSNQTQAAKATR